MKIKQVFDLDNFDGKIYWMSDLHYGHENVIAMDKRDFANIDEMNDYILENLKSKITEKDIVFDLGDTFWRVEPKKCEEIIGSIKAKEIYHILGNHDKYPLYKSTGGNCIGQKFKLVADILDITIKKNEKLYQISMSHFPMLEWNHQYHGSLCIHGHTHGHIDAFNLASNHLRVDVGFSAGLAKNLGTFIISFDDILEYFYNITDGMDFDKWAKEKYHGNLVWNPK